ncbi:MULTISPECIES: undecaprenyldiphospho-muramoylpentapeptide beta-N-acetylglucosaminyltransferase [Staphylococcus]|jgi:UDP-N-acetylglucosamine--N-acetylmuramyl-(pentapeptide) pyrophosphoryl-undecaprenol N-acetylglucosamine transferase|uniref:UDP-N-acetylglucosamine--N-acetylmuramyl-(pentapeptide) pyrophosphoryl-undecaprenol N-acetylglucosamine transferase n=1 Tax=Staphylococcus hominis TaxID=1290 RepID=A0A4Q9WUB3_STAHO|nr:MULTISPECIES: undecaprenyldiphospho-muramoylpentapeptide beta-N-acetylglucosaminyltransferase [Staphylococcus]EUZ70359.1 undecaprenyldiphospho-muramoylpentapeptide beta-N-acetylglucosaminyltransferase [Staphylococcus sp. M0480]OFM56829.1 UDP-N-acetylglucosamine--N-acetylmuramyl-(pentapeptide) pyrophosphoryl-undecaprenol N-acetylglucosamine transferase [Staphylococcus sp. HMSC059G05]OFM64016.1 UDP-N-acetylglucosamine--N-acetylmuramyl-(pentapeptide) pyrophosphoryl-undecaprenol N-acetylglucosami
MSKIAFTGGGTVGHVSVNLSLIPTALEKGHQVFYIGSKNGIEREMIESQLSNIKYYPISSGKLRRYLSFENAKDVFKVLKGILDARRVLKKEKPDLLFSKGGFVSVPVVIAARSLNIPTIIHESDLTPGLANKISLKFSKKIYTTFEDTLKYLPKDKADFVGATIREDLKEGNQQKGYEITGFDSDKKVLLVMGGSLGSKKLNDIIRENLEALLHDYQIIHLTGHGLVDESYKQKGYIQYEFVKEELTHLLSITDTVVSRAGSNAIYEFLTLRIPMLLIPLGLDQSRGDQIDNAKYFESKGYGKMIPEDQLTQFKLLEQLKQIESHRTDITHQMESYKESYTKEDLFNKILNDAL